MGSHEAISVPIEAFRPRNANRFRCIGPDCEDTCCKGWNVFIDRETYVKYQSLPDGPLRVLIGEKIEPTGNADTFSHARVKLNEDAGCPFLTEDRLCAIQKEHGEVFLSMTCSQYPRMRKLAEGVEEETLLLSCPEAARLVLLDPQHFECDEPAGSGLRYESLRHLEPGIAPAPPVLFAVLRNFSILLLKDRRYALWQRLFLLSLICKRLEALIARRSGGRIPRLLAEMAEGIQSGSLRPALEAVPSHPDLQLGVLLILVESPPAKLHENRRFTECIEDFARGIGYAPGREAAGLIKNYTEAWERCYQPWAAAHEFVLENYLLNYVIGHLFPFGRSGSASGISPWREAQLLCFQYGLVRGLLIGMAGSYGASFSSDHAIKLVQSFSKAVEHSAALLGRIENFFAVNQLNGTDGIAALLRDPAQVRIAAA